MQFKELVKKLKLEKSKNVPIFYGSIGNRKSCLHEQLVNLFSNKNALMLEDGLIPGTYLHPDDGVNETTAQKKHENIVKKSTKLNDTEDDVVYKYTINSSGVNSHLHHMHLKSLGLPHDPDKVTPEETEKHNHTLKHILSAATKQPPLTEEHTTYTGTHRNITDRFDKTNGKKSTVFASPAMTSTSASARCAKIFAREHRGGVDNFSRRMITVKHILRFKHDVGATGILPVARSKVPNEHECILTPGKVEIDHEPYHTTSEVIAGRVLITHYHDAKHIQSQK